MNKIFRVIWNSVLGRYDVASELSKSGKKVKSSRSGSLDTSLELEIPSHQSKIALGLKLPSCNKSLLVGLSLILTPMAMPVMADQVIVTGGDIVTLPDGTNVTATPPGLEGAIDVSGVGSIFTGIDLSIDSGDGVQQEARGVRASNKGTINLTGGSIATNSYYGWGIIAQTGGKATADNLAITTLGKYAYGIHAVNNGSQIDFSNGSIDTSNINSHGVWNYGANSAINVSGSNVVTRGDLSRGVYSSANTTTTFLGGSVSTEGAASHGLYVTGVGSNLIVGEDSTGGTKIATSGDNAFGAYASNNGSLDLVGAMLATTGNNASAVFAYGNGSRIEMNDSSVTTTGDSAYGVQAAAEGELKLFSANDIATSGSAAYGLYSTGVGSYIAANTTSIVTTGVDSHAVLTNEGGGISVMQTGGMLSSAQGTTLASQTGMLSAVLDGVRIDNNGTLISSTGNPSGSLAAQSGSVHLTAMNMGMSGDVVAHTDSTADLFLFNTDWTGKSTNGTNFKFDITSQWNITDNSDVATLLNVGSIRFTGNSVGRTLTVHDQYLGDGGTVLLNTVLGDDNSLTDRLVIEGDSLGNTKLHINNVGGTGMQTVVNGIQVVQVGGESTGQFTLDGRVVAGLYDYQLFQGAIDNPNDGNWYLRNTLVQVDPKLLVDMEEKSLRPEAGSYTTNLAVANNMFATRLHDRLGETQYIDALSGEQKVTSMWLRNEGGHSRSRDTSGQLKTQSNRYVMQLGGDIVQWSNNDLSRLHLGVMAGYGNSKSNTLSKYGYQSDGSVDGYTAGVYSTWYANDEDKSGLYVDGWAQYSWFNNTVKGEGLATEEYKSKGITASIESGYTFKIGENKSKNEMYFIQPKAQITWMGVKADEHREANGTQVSGEGDGNIQTRLGVRSYMKGHHESDNGKDREFQPFVEANWIHNTKDFGTSMNGVDVKQAGAKNIGELKLGVEGQLNKQLNVWSNVGQQIGDKGYSETNVMLGVKYSF